MYYFNKFIKNNTLDLTKTIVIKTHQYHLNTKIEPNFDGSKKGNVDEVTILEPCDNEILSQMMQSDNIYQQFVS